MNLNEIAFVVLVGASFLLLVGLSGLFDALMSYLFDRARTTPHAPDVKEAVVITLGAFLVGFFAWTFV